MKKTRGRKSRLIPRREKRSLGRAARARSESSASGVGGDVDQFESKTYIHLRHEGLPLIAQGRYDLRACCRWYVRYLQRKIIERANGLGTSASAAVGAAKHTILAIEVEMKQMQLAERREQLISVEKVGKNPAAIVAEIRTVASLELPGWRPNPRRIRPRCFEVKIERTLKRCTRGA